MLLFDRFVFSNIPDDVKDMSVGRIQLGDVGVLLQILWSKILVIFFKLFVLAYCLKNKALLSF